ncbi:MAG: hypothetical protein IPJ34_43675 [Myxococcales bacterium]|nr:hypothetical protein [Myxococcales bacterium]
MSSLQEDLFYAAYFRTLTDAGCTAMDFAAAVAVLKHSQSRFVASLEQPDFVLDLSPDRLAQVAAMLTPHRVVPPGPAFCDALLAAIGSAQAEAETTIIMRPVRRVHALLALAEALQLATVVPADVLVWIFAEDEYADPHFYGLLHEWCWGHEEIPSTIVDLVVRLRVAEDDSPTLHRLAAWVAPSADGMVDIALWERAACEPPPLEDSRNTAVLEQAFALHGERVREALVEAIAADRYPAVRPTLEAWLTMIGGAR